MSSGLRGDGEGAPTDAVGPTSELLAAWDAARAVGRPLSAEDLCPDDVDRLERLRERIANLRRGYQFLDALEAMGPSAPPPTAGLPEVEGFDVLEEVGRGGMGVVYRAWQGGLERFVALKMIAPGGAGGVSRFLEEARAIAALSHPHIVVAHAFGESAGRPFLVFEHLAGGTLAGRWAAEPQPPAEAAELIETLALAVAHAHARDVVHRDLKPENILFSADGVPKIGDFGLARIVEADERLSFTGDVLGTPGYMAPEQANGDVGRGDPPVDVYALGALLYEGLTGRPPFRGANRMETLRLVVEALPDPPRRLRPSIPRDLDTICMTCLRKEPGRRYAGAAELAADLRRFLDGSRILARPIGPLERAVRAIRRYPVAALASATLAIGLAAVGVGEVRWAREARRREVEALVAALVGVQTAAAPEILRRIEPHSDLARPLLRERFRSAQGPQERLHAALALPSDEPGLVDFLIDRLIDGPPEAFPALVGAMGPHRDAVIAPAAAILDDPSEPAARRLRAARILEEFDPDRSRLDGTRPLLARLLATDSPPADGPGAELLRPIATRALPALADFLADGEGGPTARRAAIQLYGEVASAGPGFATLEARLVSGRPGGPAARARAAAALLAMGREGPAWPFLGSSSPDVRRRLIGEIPAAGVDPAVLIARLQSEPDPSARQALVLALGGYDLDRESIPRRAAALESLFERYRDDPDAGVHGALHWLLEREGESTRVREADRQSKALPQDGRRWTVNVFSDVFSIVDIDGEAGPYRLAVSSTEAVAYRFGRYLDSAKGGRRPTDLDFLTPYRDGPALGVSRREALEYCNWLSRQDGLPRSQMSYVPDEQGELRLAPDHLARSGYRLPTAAEWEYLNRAGGGPTYEEDPDLLGGYARWAGNSGGHSWSVGTLMPNDLGLFDMAGNAAELCEGASPRGGSYRSGSGTAGGRPTPAVEEIGLRPVRVLPGADPAAPVRVRP